MRTFKYLIVLFLFTGTMAKSAQMPLASWLPNSMEGWGATGHIKIYLILLILVQLIILYVIMFFVIKIYN